MELIKSLLDFLLHIDDQLAVWLVEYGTLFYAILFLIVFVETGLVVMPLLPGDSLLFATGMLAAQHPESLSLFVVIPLLILAALLGDNTNYFIGKYFSTFIKSKERILFFKREYITQTEEFYEKHGGMTIIMARFVPIVRTIAPFVAGAGSMNYRKYITFCFIGAVLWVCGVTIIGYALGNIPFVKENFEKIIFLIIGLSVAPIIFQAIKSKFSKA